MTDVTAPPTKRQVPTAIVVALGVAVVLLVALGAWWWLGSGTSDVSDELSPAGTVVPTDAEPGAEPDTEAAAVDEESPSEELAAAPLEVVQVVLSRDPFQTIRPEVPDTVATDPGAPATDGTAPTTEPVVDAAPGTDGAAPTPVPAPEGGSGADGQACRTDGEVVCDGVVVSIVETLEPPAAVIEVDGVRYVAVVGDSFAERFRLLSVDGDCALIQYGDETFRQCIGAAATLK